MRMDSVLPWLAGFWNLNPSNSCGTCAGCVNQFSASISIIGLQRNPTSILGRPQQCICAPAPPNLVHGTVLDQWARIQRDRTDRNIAVHGGNIILDIRAITEKDTTEPGHAAKWKHQFENHYNITYHQCHDLLADLSSVPSEIIKCMDTRADIFQPSMGRRRLDVGTKKHS